MPFWKKDWFPAAIVVGVIAAMFVAQIGQSVYIQHVYGETIELNDERMEVIVRPQEQTIWLRTGGFSGKTIYALDGAVMVREQHVLLGRCCGAASISTTRPATQAEMMVWHHRFG